MVTVAIISEYNPFHTGHKYQINKIREHFGHDTRIVAIMSGNYTQRGDIAIIDKSIRAECAVRSGVNLVLELPFPFSISSAEIFAKCGVYIATQISVIDYLAFGSESGDLYYLKNIADNMLSEEYHIELNTIIENNPQIGYAALLERAYNSLFFTELKPSFFTANNILAIEYIKQIRLQNSKIIPYTIKRNGAEYSNQNITDSLHQSATAIRSIMSTDIQSATKYMPEETRTAILSAYTSGELPINIDNLSTAVISHFRLNTLPYQSNILDVDEGLYNRLKKKSNQTNKISELTELVGTKKYTNARIKRAIWYSYFGVTSSEIKKMPMYTQVLGMDIVGKSILKEIKKISCFPVLTKPSALDLLSDEAKLQKIRSNISDAIFQLAKPTFKSGDTAIKTTPFILD